MMESKKSGVDVSIVEEVMMKKLRVQNLGAYICSGVGTKKGVDLQIAINRYIKSVRIICTDCSIINLFLITFQ